MIRHCEICLLKYNDAECSTLCPHRRLLSPESQARKDKAFGLIGKGLRFNHEEPGVSTVRVASICWDGMVRLQGMEGEFSPDILMEAETAPNTCVAPA